PQSSLAPHQAAASRDLPCVLGRNAACPAAGGRGVTVVLREGCGDGGDDLGLKVGTGLAPLEELASDGREEDVGESVFVGVCERADLCLRVLEFGLELV